MATDSASSPAISTPPTDSSDNYTVSPYYLHHSDGSSAILVSPPLNGDNYHSWSRSMRLALSVKNKFCFVDGTLACPKEGNLLPAWLRINDVVVSWLFNSMTKEISASLLYTDLASDIWQDVKDRFSQGNGPRIFQLRRDLMNISQGNLSVSSYFTKLKTIWQELFEFRPKCVCSCGGLKEMDQFYQREYTLSFLMGLNDSYSQVISQILLMDPIPTINKSFALIVQEERQRSVKISENSSPDALAFAAFQQNSKSSNSSRPQFRKKDRPICTHCNIPGHTIDKCYKLHGYPPGFKFKSRPVNSANQVSTTVSGSSGCDSSSIPEATSLSSEQYQNIMNMLSSHLNAVKVENSTTPSASHIVGQVQLESDWQG